MTAMFEEEVQKVLDLLHAEQGAYLKLIAAGDDAPKELHHAYGECIAARVTAEMSLIGSLRKHVMGDPDAVVI
jgi:hypothetical protein